jgi:hypothetical protein
MSDQQASGRDNRQHLHFLWPHGNPVRTLVSKTKNDPNEKSGLSFDLNNAEIPMLMPCFVVIGVPA